LLHQIKTIMNTIIRPIKTAEGYEPNFKALENVFANILPMDFSRYQRRGEIISINPKGGWCTIDEWEATEIEEKQADTTMTKSVYDMLCTIFKTIGIDMPNNIDMITEFCVEDIKATSADSNMWYEGDVKIAFRRWIEKQSE